MRPHVSSRCAITVSVVAALLVACGGNVANVGTSTQSGASDAYREKTFKYSGHEQSFTVPNGVKAITVVARGASAPREPGCGVKGRGGRVYAQIPVKQGERLYIFVGSEFGFNGGGGVGSGSYGIPGGGASDVRQNGDGLADRILVAGGGGAAGEANSDREIACGGGGGGKVGGTGESDSYSYGDSAGGGGGGGSSYAEPSATNVHFWQNWKSASGNGLVVFSWR